MLPVLYLLEFILLTPPGRYECRDLLNVAHFFLRDVGPESVPFPVLVQYHTRSEGNTLEGDLGLHDLLLFPEFVLEFRFRNACHLLGGLRVLGNNHNEADPTAVKFLKERECLGLPINNEYQRRGDIKDTLHALDEFNEYVGELGGRRYEFEQNEVPIDVVELSQMYSWDRHVPGCVIYETYRDPAVVWYSMVVEEYHEAIN